MKKINKIVLVLLTAIIFVTGTMALNIDLNIRNTVAYISKMIFTDTGDDTGNTTVVVDGKTGKISGVATPTDGKDAPNKKYVDDVIEQLKNWVQSQINILNQKIAAVDAKATRAQQTADSALSAARSAQNAANNAAAAAARAQQTANSAPSYAQVQQMVQNTTRTEIHNQGGNDKQVYTLILCHTAGHNNNAFIDYVDGIVNQNNKCKYNVRYKTVGRNNGGEKAIWNKSTQAGQDIICDDGGTIPDGSKAVVINVKCI